LLLAAFALGRENEIMDQRTRVVVAKSLLSAARVLHPLSGSAPLRTLSDLRRALKAIGFALKTKAYSDFTGSTYVRLADKKVFPSVFFGEADIAQWQPLISFLKENKDAIKAIGKAEGITGLVKGTATRQG